VSEQTTPDNPNRAESEAEAADRLLHGSSFGAAAYAEHRPGYAEAAVRWTLEPVRDARPVRVADVGAGTGKLTATLIGLGAEVTAVEPDPQMLAELRRTMPEVRSVSGSAYSTRGGMTGSAGSPGWPR
jgi:SAM-dependent methyltransferase